MGSKSKIVIVDDNKEFVKLLSLYINTQDDMEVVECANDGQNVI